MCYNRYQHHAEEDEIVDVVFVLEEFPFAEVADDAELVGGVQVEGEAEGDDDLEEGGEVEGAVVAEEEDGGGEEELGGGEVGVAAGGADGDAEVVLEQHGFQ